MNFVDLQKMELSSSKQVATGDQQQAIAENAEANYYLEQQLRLELEERIARYEEEEVKLKNEIASLYQSIDIINTDLAAADIKSTKQVGY